MMGSNDTDGRVSGGDESGGGSKVVCKECSLSVLFPPIDISATGVSLADKRTLLLERKRALETTRRDIDQYLQVLHTQLGALERAVQQHPHDVYQNALRDRDNQ